MNLTIKKHNHLRYEQFIVLGYLIIILTGGILLSLPVSSRAGVWTPFLNSVFTATSATCVTGLVVYDTYTYWSLFGQLVILILIQIGGLGFMTVITLLSIFLKRNIGLHERKLLMMSAGSPVISGVVRLIRRVAIGTFIIECIGTLILATQFCPQMGLISGLYNAMFHSVSAFCNAGFDILGKYGPFCSLTVYQNNPIVLLTIASLIVIGGIGFFVWNDILIHKFHFRRYQLHTKIVLSVTALLIISGAFLLFFFEYKHSFLNLSFSEKITSAIFQSITPRTAGFNSVPMEELSESGHLLTMILMFIGGSPGSTAGGIKVTTFAVLLLGAVASSRNESHITTFKRRLDEGIVKQASAIFFLYLSLVIVSTLLICSNQSFEMEDVLFETISGLGTVGLTRGITTSLNQFSRTIIILLMFAGRVGGLTLALVLAEKRTHAILNRPVEKIMIG